MSEIKPVAWFTEDHLIDRSATTYDTEVVERWKHKGWPVSGLVLHSDHEAEVARLRDDLEGYMMGAAAEAREVDARGEEIKCLRAEISALNDDPSYETACETIRKLRAELEGLRTTLEVIAVGDSRTPHIDAAQALLRSGYWTDEIDAAMGASA